MRKQFATYGRAGGPGQGLSRFEIQGDPTPYIPIWASGSLQTTTPAHMIGDDGSAYKYGTLVVGGNQNLFNVGDVVYPVPAVTADAGTPGGSLILGGLSFYDAVVNSTYATIAFGTPAAIPKYLPMINGEAVIRDTDGTNYGAITEPFNKAGGSTVAINTGSGMLVGTGTTWNVDVLTGGYGYTPEFNKITVGDLVGIGAAGSRVWHRIGTNPGALAMTVFPAWQGANVAGVDYLVVRAGYGSTSRVVCLPQVVGSTLNVFWYYCGTPDYATLGAPPHVMAVRSNFGVQTHFMAPQTTAPADFGAKDIAYYKSFLLYGIGSSIGWSVAGFPTSFPFGATDFPAQNISVIDLTDDFVSFEFLGDQLIAVFQNSHYLVQATGIVPEFAFYKLPEPTGVVRTGVTDPQIPGVATTSSRPTTSARASIFYQAVESTAQLSGGVAKGVAEPVKSLDLLTGPTTNYTLSWEPSTDSVLVRPGTGSRAAFYQEDRGRWGIIDATPAIGAAVGLTGGPSSQSANDPVSGMRLAVYSGSGTYGVRITGRAVWHDSTEVLDTGWIWATPIICLSEVYPTFKFGGFQVWGRAATGAPIPTNLNWTIYGGSDPYHMNVRQGPIAYDYATGLQDTRHLLGGTFDDAFVGFVLSGNSWIELAGIAVFSSETAARR